MLKIRLNSGNQAGFSLVIVSVLLTVAAIGFVSVLPGQDTNNPGQKLGNTTQKLERVEEAMRSFMTANGRMPCPADGQYSENTAYFGVEAANPGACTGGVPAVPLGPDASGWVVGGTIPTKTIGLDDRYAYDESGRRITYIVDTRSTQSVAGAIGQSTLNECSYITNSLKYGNTAFTHPAITIKNTTTGGAIIDYTMHAYLSHGASGYGAFPAQGGAARMNSGSNDPDTLANANTNYTAGSYTNTFVKKDHVMPSAGDTGFDQLLWYRPDLKNTCCLGPSCKQKGFVATGSNGGQVKSISVGDVNGDGIQDLIIAAYDNNQVKIYVVFGSRLGFPDPLPLNNLNGNNGFALVGPGVNTNYPVSVTTGDVNGDGNTDIVVGVPYAQPHGIALAGATYVIYGGPGPKSGGNWAASYNFPGTITNGTNGTEFDGASYALSGTAVAVGDVNGDGINDIIIGAPGAINGVCNGFNCTYGSAYIVFGKTNWISSSYSLASGSANFLNGTNGVEYDGTSSNDYIGSSLATGDFDGDGFADILIGSQYNRTNGNGSVNLIYGQASTAYPSTTWPVSATALSPTNSVNFAFQHATYSPSPTIGTFSNTLATGDVNGDGRTDIIIGMPGITPAGGSNGEGATFVLFSQGSRWNPIITLNVDSGNAPLDGGTDGIEIDGTLSFGQSGTAVTTGDVNGDGVQDIIIGAPAAYVGTNIDSGVTYVVYGGRTLKNGTAWANAPYTLDSGNYHSIIDGLNGFQMYGGFDSLAGAALATGDINGDGVPDLAVGASGNNANPLKVYVFFGKKTGITAPTYSLGGL